ncbi:MAG: hypothetical protein IJ736_05605, partial [Firmicutes bacterium]|nr:hypothetical protein [Bacillota bacterium]
LRLRRTAPSWAVRYVQQFYCVKLRLRRTAPSWAVRYVQQFYCVKLRLRRTAPSWAVRTCKPVSNAHTGKVRPAD